VKIWNSPLAAFGKIEKSGYSFVIPVSVCLSVRPSVRMAQFGSDWKDFHDFYI
jgi:hypothetical protein